MKLRGACNDAENVAETLTRVLKIPRGGVRLLTDDAEVPPENRSTYKNIMEGLDW